MTNIEHIEWRRSSRCDTGNCLEIGTQGDHVFVRSSDNPDGPWLTFTRAEWRVFLAWVVKE